MTNKHTPGPWIVKPTASKNPFVYEQSTGKTISGIAFVSANTPRDEAEANARLIAAAPDLLAALKQALRYIEVRTAYQGAMTAAEVEEAIVGPLAPDVIEIGANSCNTLATFDFSAARAAIAKATWEG